MAKRKIELQKGYPTTDGGLHQSYREAIIVQSGIDLKEACEGADLNHAGMVEFLKKNHDIVSEYTRLNLIVKPAAKEPADKKPSKPKKPAASSDKD